MNINKELEKAIDNREVSWADICLEMAPRVTKTITKLGAINIEALEAEGKIVEVEEIDEEGDYISFIYVEDLYDHSSEFSDETLVKLVISEDMQEMHINTDKINEVYGYFKNITYDNSYGHPYLHGVVMFQDNTWLERREADGAEWWEDCRMPIRYKKEV